MASLVNAPVIFKRENERLRTGGNQTFYIINFEWKTNGFFAIMRKALSAFAIADEMGWVPFIDVQDSLYNVKGGYNGTTNMFEYYFKTINLYPIEYIKENCNYFQSSYLHILEISKSFGLYDENSVYSEYQISEEYLKYLGSKAKKYFILKDTLKRELDYEIRKIVCDESIIGIHFRGSDFAAGRHGHPISGKYEQYFNAMQEAISAGFNKFFLATDDTNVLNAFQKEFGDCIIYFDDVNRTSSDVGIHLQNHSKGNDGYYLGREVLRDMLALSYCDGLIAGLSQVSIFARIEKYASDSAYTFKRIIDNGIYHNDTKRAKDYYKQLYSGDLLK
jgi:hypothetical protein